MSIIPSIDILDDDGNVVEIRPSIPFSEFPPGAREAKPDPKNEGRLAWFVEASD